MVLTITGLYFIVEHMAQKKAIGKQKVSIMGTETTQASRR